MGLFPSLVGESRSDQRPGPTDDYWYNPVGMETAAGTDVTESSAINYLTAYACITLVSADIGRIPLILYKKNPNGSRERVTDHPVYDLCHFAANDETPALVHQETKQGHLMLWGNSFDFIEHDRIARPQKLWPFKNPGAMQVKRNNRGELVYGYLDRGQREWYPAKKIFHIPAFGFNALVGKSPISFARENIGLGLAMEKFGGKYFSQGTHPAGILSMPSDAGGMDVDDLKEYSNYIHKQSSGLGKSHKMLVVANGEKYTPLTMPLNDAQFLESRGFQKLEVCGMYHVPPHKVAIHGSNSNHNNLEQENLGYVNSCLIHWTARWEAFINYKLLTAEDRRRGLYVEFELKGLLKGDTQARSDLYKTLNQMGLPLNRILSLENMNPVDGGDDGFVPLNMVALKQALNVNVPDGKSAVKEAKAALGKAIEIRTDQESAKRRQSILVRDRIQAQYSPLIRQAAQRTVDTEAAAVRKHVEKIKSQRDLADDVAAWLDNYYEGFDERVKEEFGPVFRSFGDAVIDAANGDIGSDDVIDADSFVKDYIDRYAQRHVDASQGQLLALLRGELEDLETRVDEWVDTRPEKIAKNESTRMGNGLYNEVVFAAGLGVYWRTRGKSCPYCNTLNGQQISRGQFFIEDGATIDVEDDGTGNPGKMNINGSKSHSPLHAGCDCYTSIF